MYHVQVDSDLFLFRSESGRLRSIHFRRSELARAELVLAFLELGRRVLESAPHRGQEPGRGAPFGRNREREREETHVVSPHGRSDSVRDTKHDPNERDPFHQ